MPASNQPLLTRLPYLPDCRPYFDIVSKRLPMTALLHSHSQHREPRDRYDILTASPVFTISASEGKLSLAGQVDPAAEQLIKHARHSLHALHGLVSHMLAQPIDYSDCMALELPFCGGLLGYCSYDLGREYIALPNQALRDIDLPDMQFSFFSWALIQDHLRQQTWLVIHPATPPDLQATLAELASILANHSAARSSMTDRPSPSRVSASPASFDMSRATYLEAFSRIQDYIHAGDCYQINFAQRIQSVSPHNASEIYWHLHEVMPSPFCALLPIHGQDASIISLSPERFLQLTPAGHVTTQPIKGTIRRGTTAAEDQSLAMALQQDSKNRAENIMIVDLLRNDLGKVCETGSVAVERLCELQSFANVHHLVSTISGQLRQELNGADLLEACYPGGSITGAPKIRAMQIIEELEPTRRSIYCGTIAYFSAHGGMDSNILIRTLLVQGKPDSATRQVYCWGGGGIVADSNPDAEYEESITKIGKLIQALSS